MAFAYTKLDDLPLVLTLAEMAQVYRISVSTIRHRLQLGLFRPQPWEKYPYRWKREDVVADLKADRSASHQKKPHGRFKLAKATLDRRPVRAAR